MSIIAKDLEAQGNRHWKVTTAPSIEPVTVDEVKLFARVDGTDEDDMIAGFIKAISGMTEKYLGRALIQQTITMIMDFWPGAVIKLPRPPLISITSVVTIDEDDVETTYSNSSYYAMTQSEPGQLIIRQGSTPPTNTSRSYGGFKIRHLAGYGIGSAEVPQAIREGIKMWVCKIYETRIITDEPPKEVIPLLDLYKIPRICY